MSRRPRVDIASAARELVAGLEERPWGQISPSVYESARLVTLAPWLDGHGERLRFLAETQRADGAWGATDGYGLVPTLSATEAVLTALARAASDRPPGPAPTPDLPRMADRGLAALHRWLDGGARPDLPDTPAIEIVVPALLAAINTHLEGGRGADRLRLPPGLDDALLNAVRSALRSGAMLPAKLLHSLEVAAPLPAAARSFAPTPTWTVGASPAATATWLGDRPSSNACAPAIHYLREVARQHGGPVPSVIPITTFERAWVLTSLTDGGIPLPRASRARLTADLARGIGDLGTSGGPGLPPDGDTTSVALLALEQAGRRANLDCLLDYRGDTHFYTWPEERTPSVSTNAHVLDTLGARLARRPDQHCRYGAARVRVVRWLRGQQHPDGSWTDKWHASPFYATASCVLALGRFGGLMSRAAVNLAVRWVLDTQRTDGGWGRWASTSEETSYAVRMLLLARERRLIPPVADALARGRAFLTRTLDAEDHSPLWHDKDLYVPIAVVRATILAALHTVGGAAASLPRPRRPSTM